MDLIVIGGIAALIVGFGIVWKVGAATLEGRIYRLIEARAGTLVMIAFVAVGAGVLFLLIAFYLERREIINFIDTPFSILMGVVTILGFLLAIVSIRGLFERITEFEAALRAMTEIIEGSRDDDEIFILGYYLTFGILTLGHTATFRRFVEAVKRATRLRIYVSRFEDRKQEIEKLYDEYNCDPRTIAWIRRELTTQYTAECPEFGELYTEEESTRLRKDAKILGWVTTDRDIIARLDKSMDTVGADEWPKPMPPFERKLRIPELINWYNELLFHNIHGDVYEMSKTPDYHFVHNGERGVIFIPFKTA